MGPAGAVALPAAIPSPSVAALSIGPLTIHAYALCILGGVAVAVLILDRRWGRLHHDADGAPVRLGVDLALATMPLAIVGARLYHLATDPELYFTAGRNPWRAFAIWDGGLGIWGGVLFGALGAWLFCRRHGLRLGEVGDAVAPALAVAQAIGRLGNYANQELYGRPSTLPWAVRIDPAHRPAATPTLATYQPTFAYESLWDLGVAALVVWAARRYGLRHGRAFALYVAAYTVGRAWVEWLRVDPANHLLGLRLNDWTCLVVFVAAVAYLVATRRRGLDVELLVVRDCPHTEPYLALLRTALAEAGRRRTPVGVTVVDSETDALQQGLAGSPTLLLDGTDPFADGLAATLSCRIALPSPADVRRVLAAR